MTLDLDALRGHTAGHTSTPWVYDETLPNGVYSDDSTGSIVAECGPFQFAPRPAAERAANAQFIVTACNNFDAMLSELLAYRARDAAVAELVAADIEYDEANDAYLARTSHYEEIPSHHPIAMRVTAAERRRAEALAAFRQPVATGDADER